MDEVPGLQQALGPLEGPVKLLPLFRDGLLRRTLPGGFRQLVELCDGSRSLAELLEASSLDAWGTLSFLGRFMRLGMLEHGQAANRAAPRLGLQMPVDCQSLKSFQPARSLDLSARGMFVRTSQVFPVGDELLVRFNLPGVAHPFKIVGRVMWSSSVDTPQGVPAGMGIQFLDLTGEELSTIEQYVVELLLDRALLEEPER